MVGSLTAAILALTLSTSIPMTETDPPPPPPPPPGNTISGFNNDRSDTMGATATGNGHGRETSGTEAATDGPQDKYIRADETTCFQIKNTDYVRAVTHTPGACPSDWTAIEQELDCAEDTYALAPLWRERARPDGTFEDPEKVADGQCVTPADIAAEVQREFKSMKIAAPEATMQGNPPMVVNVHYPAYTTATTQERAVTLLDVPVVIRADPTEFTWDFDDPHSPGGSTLTTTSPGRPWHQGDATPDESWVGHTYTRLGTPGQDAGTGVDAEGDTYRSGVTVTLTTTWQGRFRIQGTSDWTDIPGTITTTSTTEPTTVTEARTRLVCDDLGVTSSC